ncbi:FCD domain-containing protein [Crenobacter cavernae]|uniref:Pyruvate dehydrogenase complex repressor n=1 Tax=Crenobacter cavernae TaxID=2290923 RepID=A0A345Y9M6_9NEIS|nr:FCD domain-containing protein [Crenobacter cavernae]AXK40628.1 FCD domain-containing protein [Crenobacter cavernae]
MGYQRVNVPRLSDEIMRQLEERILGGALKPGDRLPPERVLAEELGVSRPSLREAIQKLAARGLLQSRQGGGTYVTDQLGASFTDPWQQMLSSHPHLQDDVLEFRRVLEGTAAAFAAQRATDADLVRLEGLMNTLESAYAGGDLAAQAEADVAFHLGVAEASHNLLFAHLISSLLTTLNTHVKNNIAGLFDVGPVSDELLSQHRAIWRAINDRRPAAAREAAEAHIDFVAETLDQLKTEAERRERALARLAHHDAGR